MQNMRVFFRITLMLLSDLMVHFWLGKLWLIDLIVPVLSVADQVNQDVPFPLLFVLYTKVHYLVNVLNVLRVAVNYWSVESLSNVSAVFRASGIDGSCSITELVVGNDVNGASNIVFRHFSQHE